ncbi:hypothetical protein ES703_69273 [subsurface metagenome]
MGSRRCLLITGSCLLFIAVVLYCLFFLLSWSVKPWGIWAAFGMSTLAVLAALFIIWAIVRNIPGRGKVRGFGMVAVVMLPILYLAWISQDPSRGVELLPHASFVIAAVVAIVAGLSADAARQSAESASQYLQLARATTRPFLNLGKPKVVSIEDKGPTAIEIGICNTGNLPADEVMIDIVMLGEEIKEAGKRLCYVVREAPTICFPTEEISLAYAVERELFSIGGEEVRLHVTISYVDKSTQEKHETGGELRIAYSLKTGKLMLAPVQGTGWWH